MFEKLPPTLFTAICTIGIVLYFTHRTTRSIRIRAERSAAASEAHLAALLADLDTARSSGPLPRDVPTGDDPVGSAVAALDPDTRRAVKLRYFDGLTAGEVARALGWPEARVAEALAAARRELRDHLTPA